MYINKSLSIGAKRLAFVCQQNYAYNFINSDHFLAQAHSSMTRPAVLWENKVKGKGSPITFRRS